MAKLPAQAPPSREYGGEPTPQCRLFRRVGAFPRSRAQKGRSVNRMVPGIERRRAPSSLADEGGKAREGHRRSEDENIRGQRISANDRARCARLSYGGTRGPETLRVLRGGGGRGDKRL